MKNLIVMPERSSNPALGDKTFDGLTTTGEAMTLDGTVTRSFALVLILMVGAFVSALVGPGYMLVGAIAGFVLAIATVLRKTWAPITAPLYAFGLPRIDLRGTLPPRASPALGLTHSPAG